jgi:threonine/homoserine/homoserine lactone efflux protein|tara:strand:- start:1358 stop:2038 length:681 start_codon:yes stop_codon:yes gene_type:complete
MKHIKMRRFRHHMDLLFLNEDVWYAFLFSGIMLGLVEGYKPGPLTTVVITQTLKHNWKSGLKVALSPLLTDGPIILLCALIYSGITENSVASSSLSIAGGLFLVWLSYETAFKTSFEINKENDLYDDSLKKGVITNLLNPNPWSYWALIGAPFLIDAWNIAYWMPLLFIIGFFVCLIGAKISVALLTGYGSNFVEGKNYKRLMYFCSLTLLVFATMFFMDAINGLR